MVAHVCRILQALLQCMVCRDEAEGMHGELVQTFPHNGDRDRSFYEASDWAWANRSILGILYRITDTGDAWVIEVP